MSAWRPDRPEAESAGRIRVGRDKDSADSPRGCVDSPIIQLAVCTKSEDCKADVDGHEDDCPVEIELKRVFGF